MQTVITHKYPMNSTIVNDRGGKAVILGVSTDITAEASYLISTYVSNFDGWRRHWVHERELDVGDWKVVESKDA